VGHFLAPAPHIADSRREDPYKLFIAAYAKSLDYGDMENRIRELRKERGLTLKRLADLVGTSNQQISHLEKGRRRLTVEWMERIATALECHPSELLVGGASVRNDRERAMIELFRGLSEEQQEAFLTATAALAKPVGNANKDATSGEQTGQARRA